MFTTCLKLYFGPINHFKYLFPLNYKVSSNHWLIAPLGTCRGALELTLIFNFKKKSKGQNMTTVVIPHYLTYLKTYFLLVIFQGYTFLCVCLNTVLLTYLSSHTSSLCTPICIVEGWLSFISHSSSRRYSRFTYPSFAYDMPQISQLVPTHDTLFLISYFIAFDTTMMKTLSCRESQIL